MKYNVDMLYWRHEPLGTNDNVWVLVDTSSTPEVVVARIFEMAGPGGKWFARFGAASDRKTNLWYQPENNPIDSLGKAIEWVEHFLDNQ